jgi:hypothetical protein
MKLFNVVTVLIALSYATPTKEPRGHLEYSIAYQSRLLAPTHVIVSQANDAFITRHLVTRKSQSSTPVATSLTKAVTNEVTRRNRDEDETREEVERRDAQRSDYDTGDQFKGIFKDIGDIYSGASDNEHWGWQEW